MRKDLKRLKAKDKDIVRYLLRTLCMFSLQKLQKYIYIIIRALILLFKFERSDSEEEERETGAGARKEEPDLLRYTTLIQSLPRFQLCLLQCCGTGTVTYCRSETETGTLI